MAILTDSADARLARLETLVVELLDRLEDLTEAFGSYVDAQAPAPSDEDAADHFDYLESVGSFIGHDA